MTDRPKTILAFDPGTKLGWAVKTGRKPVSASGTENLSTKRHESIGMRFVRLEQFVDKTLKTYDPHIVLFEEVRRHVGTSAAHIYGAIISAIMRQCELHEVMYVSVPVGEIKRHWTGKGNAGKDLMIEVAKDMGYNPKDDNEADAIALAHCGADKYNPAEEFQAW